MTYQLRRMILVNAGTNKRTASQRITEIDPRGGAAVTGQNAVGKTSTLRLIPLFFGHSVGQVVAMYQGQDGVRFILPNATSAICFEYQRGSDRPEDLRLVVMRQRLDGSDAPEYRIYETGFRKEMFVHEGHFLDDGGTYARAEAMGIPTPTSKLSTAQYRSVILKTGFGTKDSDKLYRYSLNHSFGPKPLPNLDKLVATMVKSGVRFDELVQVAVDLIQDTLNGGTQGKTLKMRQQKKDIDAWLRNRTAAERALQLAPKVRQISGMRLDFITTESEWRRRRAQIDATHAARVTDSETINFQLLESQRARDAEVAVERETAQDLSLKAQAASQTSGQATSAFNTAEAERVHFEVEEAARWSKELAALGSMQQESEDLRQQVGIATAAAHEATLQYSQRRAEVERGANLERINLEQSKAPFRSQFDADLAAIDAAEASALSALDAEVAGRRTQAQETQGELQQKKGDATARVANPAVSDELVNAAEEASKRALQASNAHNAQGQHVAQRAKELGDARAAFETGQLNCRLADQMLANCTRAVEEARARLQPAPGTLLSALRAHPDEQWKLDLARVISPELLQRKDLSPHALSDGLKEGIYGWSLDTQSIDAPEWVDDRAMHLAVEHSEVSLAEARQAKEAADLSLPRLSATLEAARSSHTLAEAQASVTYQAATTAAQASDTAAESLRRARVAAKAEAQTTLASVEAQLRDIAAQLKRFEVELVSDRAGIRHAHQTQKSEALTRRDSAVQAVDKVILELAQTSTASLAALDMQLGQHLSEKGVDVDALRQLGVRQKELDADIAKLTKRKALVAAWADWVERVGPTRVAELKALATHAAEMSRQATDTEQRHLSAVAGATKAHADFAEKLMQRKREADAEIDVLSKLTDAFGDYASTRYEGIDVSIKASDLRRSVNQEAEKLQADARTMRSLFNDLYRAFTREESTTKELFEASLQGGSDDDIARVTLLVQAYERIPHQVVNNLNTTLGTVLAEIGHFSRAIAKFESEVGTFNKQLQTALGAVECFARMESLTLNIVADFSSLGFYRKLKRMDEVVRQHRTGAAVSYSDSMPSAQTAEALTDFMSALHVDGSLEVSMASHITLHGSVIDNGKLRSFQRAQEFANISSNGVTTLILTKLLVGFVNMVRREHAVHVPWVLDEVGKFDMANFKALMTMLHDNCVDVVTASPDLSVAHLDCFSNVYRFEDNGVVRRYAEPAAPLSASTGVQQ